MQVLSALQVQQIAAAAVDDQDGGRFERVRELSQIGASGAALQNCSRDIMIIQRKESIILEKLGSMLYSFSVPKVSKNKAVPDTETAWASLPHETFGLLFEHAPALFRRVFATSAIARFWDEDMFS